PTDDLVLADDDLGDLTLDGLDGVLEVVDAGGGGHGASEVRDSNIRPCRERPGPRSRTGSRSTRRPTAPWSGRRCASTAGATTQSCGRTRAATSSSSNGWPGSRGTIGRGSPT